jgi:hypothetical protein
MLNDELDVMNIRRFAIEVCWFAASALALVAFGFVVAWFDGGTAYPPTPARDALLIISAGVLFLVAVLIVLAFSSERKTQQRKSEL